MNTLTAIGMALLFVVGLYLLIVTVFLIGMFLYKFILGATIRKIPQEEFPAYLASGYFTHKKRWLYFTLFFLGFHSAIYMQQRMELIGNDRAYLEAKEYFAAAGVVTLYRKTLNNYFEIDHPIMRPINAIHMKFYDKGIAFIPQSDGEYDYWKYRFDLYYYVRKLYVPWDKDKSGYMFGMIAYKYYKPVLHQLMDESFQTMRALMEKPIKDPIIAQDDRYKTFTRLVVFYEMHVLSTYKLHCVTFECEPIYSRDTLLPRKDEILLEYLRQTIAYLEQHPIDEKISHLADALMAMSWIDFRHFEAAIGNDTFACDNPHIQEYAYTEKAFMKLKATDEYQALPKMIREKHYENWFMLPHGTTCLLQQQCKENICQVMPTNSELQRLITKTKELYNEQ